MQVEGGRAMVWEVMDRDGGYCQGTCNTARIDQSTAGAGGTGITAPSCSALSIGLVRRKVLRQTHGIGHRPIE